MKLSELRSKSAKELEDLVVAKRKELNESRLKLRTEEVKNVRAGRGIKREIAQILSIKSEAKFKTEEAK